MEDRVMQADDETLTENWRKLQTSDHFYYMCTKWFSDGDVHAYFSPYESPYDAYIAFMNALGDLQLRVTEVLQRKEVLVPASRTRSLWSRIVEWFKRLLTQVPFINRRMKVRTP
jgi:alpha-amylase/alpha-mannosidase (GH57 family)